MIKGIHLQNFLSFDDIHFDLIDKGGRGINHAFIYGENGSGKTNLIDSLIFLCRSTMTLFNEDDKTDSDAFRKLLDALKNENIDIRTRNEPGDISSLAGEYRMIDSNGDMTLKFIINIAGHDATYNLEFDEQNNIKRESLDFVISKKKGNLFRIARDGIRLQKDLATGIYKKEITGLLSKYWGKHTFIAILMHESAMKNEKFFDSKLSANIRSFMEYLGSLIIIKKNQKVLPSGRQIHLPTGIMPLSRVHELDTIERILSKFFSRLYSDIKSVHFIKETINDERVRYSLFFDKKIAGKLRSIPAENESTGTRSLMAILPFLLMCVDGKTVIIDELDTGIHDLLVSQLIKQCIPEITGQLIATTHNTFLMTYRDAPNIFIISIDRKGFKRIASIQSTEPPNIKTNIQKRYFEGYYSGIPLTADIGLKDILESSKKREAG